ncbi:MAG: DUF4167 domain-containing protein [Pseudomonadota bacterium]
MRSPQKNNRSRGRGRGKNNGNSANRVYESTGPEGKVRGTPQQIIEKYLTLARDAQTSGDRVIAENFLQHAEHYQRILIQAQASQPQPEQRRDEQPDAHEDAEQPSVENGMAAEPEAQPKSQPAEVSGLTTIDASAEHSNGTLLEDDISSDAPAKPRRNNRRRNAEEEPQEVSAPQPEA